MPQQPMPPHPGMPPPQPGLPPQHSHPQHPGYPAPPGYVPAVATPVQPTNGLAVASMVVSLVAIPLMCVWIGYLLGLLGVIFGHAARRQIRVTGAHGTGMATAGMVIGYFVVGLLVLVLGILFLGLAVPLIGAAQG
ncbi:DUF4190 domain-containing protein [Saccharopolyspora sp. HNM0983]|uniref:DUF4190 domain-containing protein n=2 Tax=Saccharopolyspora montiporae TaxID=2781240 RepID=A0A929B7E1_9PSEU|nr:DUF4190 domain-containing protein [Saccharopolyspora sp. HNM0983]